MRLLIQRVKHAAVTINNSDKHEISKGMCVFIGVTHGDNKQNADWLAEKLTGLRIFEDSDGKINLSVKDIDGEILLVSQFSLYASCAKGRRPSFTDAAKPDEAEKLYDYFVERVKLSGVKNVQCGEFGADMTVEIINDGPLTFIVDSI
ncbi:MAG: D-tyrosyl-tRNA(Tyr) deacylase [Synergistaceae bacterium]|nr:D-tyrosyl-tRNA(Tyr) deacylase [Synergistaceae bacterium]MBR0278409.1 D-tyrosyl-tRNA(Tyr) deacylase [Synergistaceae bacterium]